MSSLWALKHKNIGIQSKCYFYDYFNLSRLKQTCGHRDTIGGDRISCRCGSDGQRRCAVAASNEIAKALVECGVRWSHKSISIDGEVQFKNGVVPNLLNRKIKHQCEKVA